MNPIVKQKWVDALRSGVYKQGLKRLRDGSVNGGHEPYYCCLGVLVDLYCKEHATTFGRVCEYGREVLPLAVQQWAGLSENDIDAPNPLVEDRALAEWNDVQRADFNKIADLIERNL